MILQQWNHGPIVVDDVWNVAIECNVTQSSLQMIVQYSDCCWPVCDVVRAPVECGVCHVLTVCIDIIDSAENGCH